jgi:phospholipase C
VIRSRRCWMLGATAAAGLAGASALAPIQAGALPVRRWLRAINHIVVIYEENHSSDNLYGS